MQFYKNELRVNSNGFETTHTLWFSSEDNSLQNFEKCCNELVYLLKNKNEFDKRKYIEFMEKSGYNHVKNPIKGCCSVNISY